jgi:protein TonB
MCWSAGKGSEKPDMADGIAQSVGLPRVLPGRRKTMRTVGEAEGSAGSAVSLLAPAVARPMLSGSHDLFGIGPGGWIGAAMFYATVIAGGLWLGWQATPPEPWPESEAAFRVIFETAPAPQAEAIPAPAEVPPPEALAPPEPPPLPPVLVAEPEPAQALPQPPPPKPEPRRAATKPPPAPATASPSATPAASEPPVASAPPQLAALPIIPPQAISGRAGNAKPDYPAEARRRGLQGKVVLLVEVSAAGLPASVAVASSSGHAALDQAALAAVQRWHFSPATRGGTPVAGTAQVPIQFRLEE